MSTEAATVRYYDGTMEQMKQMLILMKGHPGCAKSTVSRGIARALRCPVVDKDDIRDATLSLEDSDRLPPPAPTLLNTLSYDIMWRVVATQLQIGLSVVVDCPLARPALFQVGSRLAQQYGCALLIVECVASDRSEWKRRLEERARTAADLHFEDNATSTNSSTPSGLKKSTNVSLLKDDDDFCGASIEVLNRESELFEQIPDVERVASGSDDDSVEEAIGSRSEKTSRRWHKPSLWTEIEQLIEGYAKCYEYDTGITKKLVVDTTSISSEAAVSGILNWLRQIDEKSSKTVSFMP